MGTTADIKVFTLKPFGEMPDTRGAAWFYALYSAKKVVPPVT